ncbi:MAG: hypothetical protein IH934_07200 [Nanoarchaeota archaeon]|nr:hypothetical protein [Nanoarchaeota archaeon]
MATFLDVTALENFSIIFVFLLAWLGGYAMLLYTKVLGGQNQFINIILSLVFAIFVIISPLATLIFKTLVPIVAVVMLLVVIVYSASGMFGNVQLESMQGLKWTVLAILVVALVVGTGAIVRENINVPERGEDFGKISTVIFHPNFLGMILILLIAVFTVGLLAVKQM